jgi:hypothetical protein
MARVTPQAPAAATLAGPLLNPHSNAFESPAIA